MILGSFALIVWGILITLNLAAIMVMAWDKSSARHNRRRVPERTLWTLALCGGAWGIWGGMYFYRHKTQHWQFVWGVPVLIAVQTWFAIRFGWLAI